MDHLRSIVVGIDFSPSSADALAQAHRIAATLPAPTRPTVKPVHVIDSMSLVEIEVGFAPMVVSLQQGLIEDAHTAWTGFAPEIAHKGALDVTVATPWGGLYEAIQRSRADLAVLGVNAAAPDSEAGARVGTGPLATRVVRHAPCDVLLVRRGKRDAFRTIVACVDFSETSLEAVRDAERMAAMDGSALHIIHVFKAPWQGWRLHKPRFDTSPAAAAKYREMLRTQLEQFCRPERPENAWAKPRYEVVEGRSHGEGIVRYTTECGADLVMLGTRGKTNLRDVLLGSTAEHVVQNAQCSVLVTKPVTKPVTSR
jgi:nucleotide-binding universal stress UspA family protein